MNRSQKRQLFNALPKATFSERFGSNVSYIYDVNGEIMGDVYWNLNKVTIYESYEYADEVLERLGNFTEVKRDYNISDEPPVTFEGSEPTLTEYGKKLYDKPSNIDESTINQIIQ